MMGRRGLEVQEPGMEEALAAVESKETGGQQEEEGGWRVEAVTMTWQVGDLEVVEEGHLCAVIGS